jgi:tetratricopeptide (TPR) repeat protein
LRLRFFFSLDRCSDEAIRHARKIAPAITIFAISVGGLNATPRQGAQSAPAEHAATPAATDPARQIEAVRKAFDAGHNAEALRLADRFSAQQKSNAEFHTQLGVVLATNKQYKAAQLELEKANALKPDSFDVLFPLAQTYVHNNRDSDAELALNRALKLRPDSPETQYLLAEIYFRQGKSSDAIELLARAHKAAPQNADVIFLLARVGMTQGFYEDAIPLLESGVKVAPKRADLRAALGESYFMAGKDEKAIEVFKSLIEIDPAASSYAFMGLSYRHLGRYEEARKYFEAGLKKDPHNASCLFNLGFIAMRQGDTARAEDLLQQSLRYRPDMPEALLELADLRINANQFEEAAVILRRYVKVAKDPAAGYYRLSMTERNLHQDEAAERDLSVFQTLYKNAAPGPYPYQNLFDYAGTRANLSEHDRAEMDVKQLTDEVAKHPDQPQNLYLLAEANLKLGSTADARQAISQLDETSSGDFRTQAGVGVLLARYRLYDDAIAHFQTALKANADADDVKFDLADAYFRKGLYQQALDTANQVSEQGRQDDSYLALLGDIYAHLGDTARATEIFRDAIRRNPDNDQYYLSLALVQLRGKDVDSATATLRQGIARIPSSGKLSWGLGVVSVLEGKTRQAADRFERAVNLLPEWAGSYSTLGIFYYQNGEIAKARELLARFKGSNAGGLDVNRIEQALAQAPERPSTLNEPMPENARVQFLQMALSVADRTL